MNEEALITATLNRARDAGLPEAAVDWLRPRLRLERRRGALASTRLTRDGRYTVGLDPAAAAEAPSDILADILRHELLHISCGDLTQPADPRRPKRHLWLVAWDLRINALLPRICERLCCGMVANPYESPYRDLAPTPRPTAVQWYAVLDALPRRPGKRPSNAEHGEHQGGCAVDPAPEEYDRATEAVERLGARAAIADDESIPKDAAGALPPGGDAQRRCAPIPPAPPDPAVALARILARHLGTARLERARSWRRAHRTLGDLAPGSARAPRGRILVAIDQSGSMGPEVETVARAVAALKRLASVEYTAHTDAAPAPPSRQIPATCPGCCGTRFGPLYGNPLLERYDLLIHVTDGDSFDVPPPPSVPLCVLLTHDGRWRLPWKPRACIRLSERQRDGRR